MFSLHSLKTILIFLQTYVNEQLAKENVNEDLVRLGTDGFVFELSTNTDNTLSWMSATNGSQIDFGNAPTTTIIPGVGIVTGIAINDPLNPLIQYTLPNRRRKWR